jgi:hypothetical protein
MQSGTETVMMRPTRGKPHIAEEEEMRMSSTASAHTTERRMAKKAGDDGQFPSFGKVLRDQLIEREIVTGMGNPNWSAFAQLLDTVHYETLRKAVTGERQPSPKVMEESAAALGEKPEELFVEYRVWQAQRMFDPREVGVSAALANLDAWAAAQKRKR